MKDEKILQFLRDYRNCRQKENDDYTEFDRPDGILLTQEVLFRVLAEFKIPSDTCGHVWDELVDKSTS